MTEHGIGLAFLMKTRYLVHTELGGLMALPPCVALDEVTPTAGWEIVTRDELFSRWPFWKQEYDRLERQLADTGTA